MIAQRRREPRVVLFGRVTPENYDYLYRVARQRDVSISRALSEILDACRRASTSCFSASKTKD